MSTTKTPNPDDTQALAYEAVVERLNQTVEKLEKGELPLEGQIAAFEEGVRLVRRGQALLDAAEKKVDQLLDSDAVAPFAGADEDAPF